MGGTVAERPWRPEQAAIALGRPFCSSGMALPGMPKVKLLRSPHAHARIVRVCTAAACALPGVEAGVAGADVLALPKPCYRRWIADQPLPAASGLDEAVADGEVALFDAPSRGAIPAAPLRMRAP